MISQPKNLSNQPVSRIGIIGDVHAEHELLDQALAFFAEQELDLTICTGDLADGSGCIDSCMQLLLDHDVKTIRGNHDRWLLTDTVRHIPDAHQRSEVCRATLAFLEDLPTTLEIDTVAGPLLLCHGAGSQDLDKIWPGSEKMTPDSSETLDAIIEENKIRVVVNGHMHYRVLINFETMTLINAGTLKPMHRPGISILDLGADQITGFEFSNSIASPGFSPVRTLTLTPDKHRRVWRNTQSFDSNWQPTVLYGPPL